MTNILGVGGGVSVRIGFWLSGGIEAHVNGILCPPTNTDRFTICTRPTTLTATLAVQAGFSLLPGSPASAHVAVAGLMTWEMSACVDVSSASGELSNFHFTDFAPGRGNVTITGSALGITGPSIQVF